MTDLTTLVIVCNLGIVAILAYYKFFWSNETAFQLRRGLLIGLPILVIIFSNLSIEIAGNSTAPLTGLVLPDFLSNSTTSNAVSFNWFDLTLVIYFLGLSFKVWQWSKQWLALKTMVDSSERTRYSDHNVVSTKHDIPTFSFWNTIFLGRSNKAKDEDELIYRHELVHIQQKHSIDILFYDVLSIIFWFNPAVYALKKEMKLVHELLADAVVCQQADPVFYTDLLINQTLYHMNNQWMNHFAQHHVLKRVKMLKAGKKKTGFGVLMSVVPFVLVMFLALACETAPMTEASSETTAQADRVYDKPEVMPAFKGGMEGLIGYLTEEIKYPESAKASGLSGKVMVKFVIAKDGSVTSAEVLKGFDEDCDAEALRVIENMPNWTSGTVEGKNVAVSMVLPIQFKI